MSQLQIIQNFNFPGEIVRKSALDWSADNKIAVCTSKGIYVFSSYVSPIETGFPLPLHKQVIPLPTEFLDFKLAAHLPNKNFGSFVPDALYKTYMDHTITPTKEPHFLSYKYAVWSPKGVSPDGNTCLLATLTVDHRLILFQERDREWHQMCDLSEALFEIRKDSCPDIVKEPLKDSSYDPRTHNELLQYVPVAAEAKKNAYNIALMEMTWTDVFISPSLIDPESCIRWCYLITALKNGRIVWWKVSPDDPKMVTLAFEWNPDVGMITSLKWQQTGPYSGFLVIGTWEGLLTLSSIAVRLDGADRRLLIKPMYKIWAESDKLSVDNIAVLKTSLKRYILVVTKQCFLISCEVSVLENDIVIRNIGHSRGLHRLPVTGLSLMGTVVPQTQIMLASMDGLLISVKLNKSLKEIEFSHESLCLDVDFKHNTIQGLGVSPNGLLGAAILNTSAYYDHLIKREPLQFVMFVTKPFEDIFAEFSRVLKPQLTFLPAVSNNIYSYIDFLECVRILLATGSAIPDLFDSLIGWTIDAYERLSSIELYFLRFLLKCFLSELAINVPYDKQDLSMKLDVLENIIMQNYISKIVGSCHDKIELLSPAQSQSLLLMADWLYMHFETPINNLYESFGYDCPPDIQSIPPREICRICELPVKLVDIRYGECEQKHKFGRCCQSLILCDVTPYYQCLSCKSMALEDVWSNKFICTYCSLPMTR